MAISANERRGAQLIGIERPIGVFGGTFDPVHHGHLRIAMDALEQLALAEVRLIPLAHAVHRDQPETPGDLRLAMLQAAIKGRTGLIADNRELLRDNESYTVDTLRSLADDMPGRDLCLLLGDDAFAGFLDWKAPEAILELANIAVLRRPGAAREFTGRLGEMVHRRQTQTLRPGSHGQIRLLPVTQLDIASSDIRQRLAAGRSADFLLPDAVLSMIRENHLYR
jgi:nicotinate-nucleotide adenylyltransferase